MNKKVSDLANLNAERITGDATFEQAALVMKKINVGMLPVVHHVKNMVEGVITDRDILVRGIAQNKKDVRVNEIMSTKLVFVYKDDDLETALKVMKENKIRRLLVVEKDNRFLGVLTLSDIVRGIRGNGKYEKEVLSLLRGIYEQRGSV